MPRDENRHDTGRVQERSEFVHDPPTKTTGGGGSEGSGGSSSGGSSGGSGSGAGSSKDPN